MYVWPSIKWAYIYLLGRDLIVVGPHVDLLVGVHTREDEEHPGSPGATHQQPTQPEDDGSLIFLKHDKVKTGPSWEIKTLRSGESLLSSVCLISLDKYREKRRRMEIGERENQLWETREINTFQMDFAAKLKDKFVRVFLFKLYWQHDLAKKFGKVRKCTGEWRIWEDWTVVLRKV